MNKNKPNINENNNKEILSSSIKKVVDDNMIKVVAWYDNEMGYTAQMLRTLLYFCKL